jgi:CoA:oxalate CoA-transferase
LWGTFCRLIQRENLVADARFQTNSCRTNNQKQLKAILDEVFPTKSVDEWIEILDGAGIPCGPINTVDRAITDPQVQAREMIVEIEHPVAGRLKMPGVPIKLSETPGGIERPAPLLGQHTEEILYELFGMSSDQVQDFRRRKVI